MFIDNVFQIKNHWYFLLFSSSLRFFTKTWLFLQCSIFATMFNRLIDTRKRLFFSFNRFIGKKIYSTCESLRIKQGSFTDSLRVSYREGCASIKCSVSFPILIFYASKIFSIDFNLLSKSLILPLFVELIMIGCNRVLCLSYSLMFLFSLLWCSFPMEWTFFSSLPFFDILFSIARLLICKFIFFVHIFNGFSQKRFCHSYTFSWTNAFYPGDDCILFDSIEHLPTKIPFSFWNGIFLIVSISSDI